MAEKYGEVPKKFTKKWWEYFWMYYKWHTIAIAFVVLIGGVTIVQCATREKFDLTVTYMGSTAYSQDCLDKAEELCNQYALDSDMNGEANVFFQQLTISGIAGSEQMDYAMQTKHDLELSTDGSFVFIYDDGECENQLNRNMVQEVYLDVREWADTEIPDERLVKAADGTPVAVKLTADSILSGTGINTDGLSVCVRQNYSDKEYNKAAQQGAIDLANAIIK